MNGDERLWLENKNVFLDNLALLFFIRSGHARRSQEGLFFKVRVYELTVVLKLNIFEIFTFRTYKKELFSVEMLSKHEL